MRRFQATRVGPQGKNSNRFLLEIPPNKGVRLFHENGFTLQISAHFRSPIDLQWQLEHIRDNASLAGHEKEAAWLACLNLHSKDLKWERWAAKPASQRLPDQITALMRARPVVANVSTRHH